MKTFISLKLWIFPTGWYCKHNHALKAGSTVIKDVMKEAILYAATINEQWSFTLHFHCDLQRSLIQCVHVQIGITLIKLFMILFYGSPVFFTKKNRLEKIQRPVKRRPF